MAEENYGFDIKYTAKKKPYLAARFGEKVVKIADFDDTEGVMLFLKLLALYGKQEYEKGTKANNDV